MKDEQWVEAVEDNWPKLRYMESEMKEETVWDGATKVRIMVTDKVSERIEYIRESNGMTRAGFAKSIGISPQGYAAMVKNDYIMPTTAIAVEYVYGYNRKWTAGGEMPMRIDVWENMRGEIEERLLRDVRGYIEKRLKGVKPLLTKKDEIGSY